MVVCSHCGQESREFEQFCRYCGQPLNVSDYGADNGAHASALNLAPSAAGVDASDDYAHTSAARAAGAISVAITGPLTRLIVRRASTDDDQREYLLDGRDVAIGRAPSCDIVLEGDPHASRRHAVLRARNGGYVVADLGSSNGTYVNGYEIREATPLDDGDRIGIGSFEIVYATTGLPGPNALIAGEHGSLILVPPDATSGPDGPYPSPLKGVLTLGGSAGVEGLTLGMPEDSVPAAGSGSWATTRPVTQAERKTAAKLLAGSESADRPTSKDLPKVPRAESKVAPLSDDAAHELEALRVYFDDIVTALTRKADDEARIAGQLRAMLVDIRDQLGVLIQRHAPKNRSAGPVGPEHISELAHVARQAAENPHDVDYLASVATHADDIAAALETARPLLATGAVPADELEWLRARVNDILGSFPIS
jgi:hypothetical protein